MTECEDARCQQRLDDTYSEVFIDRENTLRGRFNQLYNSAMRKGHIVTIVGFILAPLMILTGWLYGMDNRLTRAEERYISMAENIQSVGNKQDKVLEKIEALSVEMASRDRRETIRHEYDSTERVEIK